jgi:GNAT superfamily N-acetyltransferase
VDSTHLQHPVRPATIHDAPELARLLTALGHPTTAQSIIARWAEWIAEGNAGLVVSRDEGTLSGLATLHRMMVLHRPMPVGRITALVVDAADRGRGIGRALVAAAEAELSRLGCGMVEVTSNIRLVDAHPFYLHLGYERTSYRFSKALSPNGDPVSVPPPL